jgi:radical SAM superfamily enzyme YgiQ (UPF0313 family)
MLGEKMRITFIFLPAPYLVKPDMYAPLGIMALAAVLEKQGETVGLENYSAYSMEEAIDHLPEREIYGITATSLELSIANEFAGRIKEKYPKSTVILGGPGAVTPEYLDKSVIDSICIGEGEITIQEMVHDYKEGILKKIYHGKPLEDLDSVPFPARHLAKDKLGDDILVSNPGPGALLMASRGCPFNCTFCATTRKNIRFRSIESVVEEIKTLIRDFGMRRFRFADDLLAADQRRMKKLAKLLEPLDIQWRTSNRAKPISMDRLKAMYDSGCREANFGVESFDNNVLRMLNKGTTAKDNARACELSTKAGMVTRVLFMIRTPGQTARTVPTNIKWLEKIPYDAISCTVFMPLPGSQIWAQPERFDIEILTRDLDKYNVSFWAPEGKRTWPDIIKIKGRSLKAINRETEEFREYLIATGKLNLGASEFRQQRRPDE